jgi:hypothetical protein
MFRIDFAFEDALYAMYHSFSPDDAARDPASAWPVAPSACLWMIPGTYYEEED